MPDVSPRTVRPWVGTQYGDGARDGLKLLLVGDSHYDAAPYPGLTQDVVSNYALSDPPIPFFEHLRFISLGFEVERSTEQFWHRVSFCNLIQDCMLTVDGVPTEAQIVRGWLALRETVAELRPDLMFVFSRRCWDANIVESGEIDSQVTRPSGRFDSDIYGLHRYERVGQKPLISAVFNHPRRSLVWRGVWQSWAENAWKKAAAMV